MIEQLVNERHIGAVFVSQSYELANKLRDDLQRVYLHIRVANGERIVLSDTQRTVAAYEKHQNEYYGLEILERSAFVHEQRLAGGVHLLRVDVVAVQSACVLAEHLEMPVVRALELIDARARATDQKLLDGMLEQLLDTLKNEAHVVVRVVVDEHRPHSRSHHSRPQAKVSW